MERVRECGREGEGRGTRLGEGAGEGEARATTLAGGLGRGRRCVGTACPVLLGVSMEGAWPARGTAGVLGDGWGGLDLEGVSTAARLAVVGLATLVGVEGARRVGGCGLIMGLAMLLGVDGTGWERGGGVVTLPDRLASLACLAWTTGCETGGVAVWLKAGVMWGAMCCCHMRSAGHTACRYSCSSVHAKRQQGRGCPMNSRAERRTDPSVPAVQASPSKGTTVAWTLVAACVACSAAVRTWIQTGRRTIICKKLQMLRQISV